MWDFCCDQLTEAGAHQCGKHKVAGLVLSCNQSCREPHPAANFAFAQHRQTMSHGVNLLDESECRRVKVPQQTVGQRCFRLQYPFHFPWVELLLRDCLEQPKIVDLVCGDLSCLHQFRPAEKVALKIHTPACLRCRELLPCF